MCIHERQLLLESFLFNNYFYFFTDLSRFHCDIGGSFFFPVITPLEFSVTLFLFEELYVAFSWEVIGLMSGFSVSFLFLATVTLDFSPVIFVVLTVVFCTVTEMTCFLPLASVMVTLIII